MIPAAWVGLTGWKLAGAVLRTLWPLLAVVAVLLALWAVYRAGVRHERAEWQHAVAAWDAAAARMLGEMTTVVEVAKSTERAAVETRAKIAARYASERTAYYAARPAEAAAVCLPVERVRAANEAIAELRPAAPAGGGPRDLLAGTAARSADDAPGR